MRGRRRPEVIAGRVNADGSIAAGDGFTVSKGAVGTYTVTLQSGFRLTAATASATAAVTGAYVTSPAERSFNVAMVNGAAAAIDQAFHFVAVGVQT